MKKLIIAACFITSFCASSFAQLELQATESGEFIKFIEQKNTLYAVLTGDQAFDDCLKSAVENEWKCTKYKFVNESEFNSAIQSSSPVGFLKITMAEDPKKGNEKGHRCLDFGHASNGKLQGYHDTYAFKYYLDYIAYKNGSVIGTDKSLTDLCPELPFIVRAINKCSSEFAAGHEEYNGGTKESTKAQKVNLPLLKTKILLIDSAYLKDYDVNMASVYKGKYQFINMNFLSTIKEEDLGKYALFLMTRSLRDCNYYIIDLKTSIMPIYALPIKCSSAGCSNLDTFVKELNFLSWQLMSADLSIKELLMVDAMKPKHEKGVKLK